MNGGIADLIGNALEGVYGEAMLIKMVRVEAKNGDITQTAFGYECYHHPISANQAYRAAAGLADKELEVIVLASHLGDTPVEADDELVSDTQTYSVVSAKLDGPKSQWRCVCKEKS